MDIGLRLTRNALFYVIVFSYPKCSADHGQDHPRCDLSHEFKVVVVISLLLQRMTTDNARVVWVNLPTVQEIRKVKRHGETDNLQHAVRGINGEVS